MQLSASSTTELAMVPVRNVQPGITVFSDEMNKIVITWQGVGQPGDIQMVPTALLSHPALADNVMKGVLVIDEQSNAYASLQAGAMAWQDQQAAAAQASINVMDTSRADEMLMVACLGPGSRPGASCETATSLRQSQQGKVPPLCDRHASLKDSFVPIEVADPATGLPVTSWTLVQATARQTQLI